MPKRSRLAVKNVRFGFQIVPPFENRTKKCQTGQKKSGFRMVFNKMAAKTIRKPDTKSVQKMTIQMPDSPVFGGSLYRFRGTHNDEWHM
jgi:hypothetical protein